MCLHDAWVSRGQVLKHWGQDCAARNGQQTSFGISLWPPVVDQHGGQHCSCGPSKRHPGPNGASWLNTHLVIFPGQRWLSMFLLPTSGHIQLWRQRGYAWSCRIEILQRGWAPGTDILEIFLHFEGLATVVAQDCVVGVKGQDLGFLWVQLKSHSSCPAPPNAMPRVWHDSNSLCIALRGIIGQLTCRRGLAAHWGGWTKVELQEPVSLIISVWDEHNVVGIVKVGN